MASTSTFRTYFKKRLILVMGAGILTAIIRIAGGYKISFLPSALFILLLVAAALIIAFVDYQFRGKAGGGLISKDPLQGFKQAGFSRAKNSTLEGHINDYRIIFSTLVNAQGERCLNIVIPLEIREGLEQYFARYNDLFRFSISEKNLFAKATLNNYDKAYNYKRLFTLIDDTTKSLKADRIEPSGRG